VAVSLNVHMSLPEPPATNHDDSGALKMQSVDARVAVDGESIEKPGNGHVASEPELREDDSCEEDEEDEEEEPSLKYERIAGALPDLLKKDAASALAIMNKKMVLNLPAAPSATLCFPLRLWEHMAASCTSSTSPASGSNHTSPTWRP
jgi:hypothetical protein